MFPLGTSLSLCFSYIAQCKCFEYRFGEMDSHTSVTEFQVFLICLPGIAILGESSWSQGDSEILEPGKKEMKSWKFCSMKCFIVLFGYFMLHSFYFFFLSITPVSTYIWIENPLHTKCTIPCGDHKLPAGGPGRQVLPEGQMAVHGSGWGPGTEKQHQVKHTISQLFYTGQTLQNWGQKVWILKWETYTHMQQCSTVWVVGVIAGQLSVK